MVPYARPFCGVSYRGAGACFIKALLFSPGVVLYQLGNPKAHVQTFTETDSKEGDILGPQGPLPSEHLRTLDLSCQETFVSTLHNALYSLHADCV